MTTLILHIEYLLRSHDCVIVPTLGAFIISRRPAYFDREAGVIIPPSAAVTFNNAVCNNDGLLASSIARRLGVTYDEAIDILDEIVASMRTQLASERTLRIGSLGTLTLGNEDNIIFTPATNEIERFGLHSILLPRIAPPVESDQVTVESPALAAEPSSVAQQERKFNTDRYYYLPINKRFARVASVLIVIIASVWVMLTFTPEIHDAPHRDCASVIPVVTETLPPISKQKTDIQPVAAVEGTDTVSKYHIVVGTFTGEAEANRFVERHAESGFDLRIVPGRRYTRVTAARSNDRSEMVATLRSERLDSCFHHSWIWEN